jgi:putative ABC transport system permease protein
MLRQTLAVCAWNIRSIGSRLPNALVVVIGFFTVIAVLSSVLATRDGIALSTARPGSEAIAVVSASNGRPDAHTLDLVGQTPGVLRDANGPMAGGVAVGVNWIRDWRPDTLGIMAVYGIERGKIALLPNFRLLKGRMFRPGLNELMIGKGEVRLYPEFGLGKTMQWHHHSWKVVGEFETGSDVQDSLFLGDLHQIQAAIAKGNGYDYISARLTSPAAFDTFKKSLESRPGSSVYVKRLSEQDSDLGKPFQIILSLAAAVITLLMSVGAIFASLNVMYANVSSRTGELAVLRALGFSRAPLLLALLSEAMLLAVVGGVLGVAAAGVGLNGLQSSTIMGSRQVTFEFAITLSSVATAMGLTLGMGFLGGLFPAIRAARQPIALALREE